MIVDGKEDAPWVEKYRPQTLDDVAAHKEIVDTSASETFVYAAIHGPACHMTVRQCDVCHACAVKRLVKEERFPHVLFYGPPGTGKTSTILAVARQMYGASMRSMVLELNASDDRGISIVREQVVDFASTRTMFRCA